MLYRTKYEQELTSPIFFHVFSRGNEKRTIFRSQADYARFIKRAQEYAAIDNISFFAYCLMTNHFHFGLSCEDQEQLSKFMHRLEVSYAMYFNQRYKRVGHLYQGRFHSKIIADDDYLLEVSAYIHNNSCDLGIDPEAYRWSSYQDYLGGKSSWIDKDRILSYFNNVEDYRLFVNSRRDSISNLETRPDLEYNIKL